LTKSIGCFKIRAIGGFMYKVTVFHNTYYVDDIKNHETELIKLLQEKGKELELKETIIFIDSLDDNKESYIYIAKNIDTDNPSLKLAYRLLKLDNEKEPIIIESAYDQDNNIYNKKAFRISGITTGLSFVGLILALQKVYDSLKTTHSIKSFDFLFNSAIASIFALATSIGMGFVLDETICHFVDKNNLKKDKSLQLIKE